jgi:hypothetical protein
VIKIWVLIALFGSGMEIQTFADPETCLRIAHGLKEAYKANAWCEETTLTPKRQR